jgi:hypothetical protein
LRATAQRMLPAVIMQRFHTIFRKGVCVMLSLPQPNRVLKYRA